MGQPFIFMSAGGERISVVFEIFLRCGLKYDEANNMDNFNTAFGPLGYDKMDCSGTENEIRGMLRDFRKRAEADRIPHYGLRSGVGPCNVRWGILSMLLEEEWPDAIWISTMKRPAGPYINQNGQTSRNEFTVGGWMTVIASRREMVLSNGYVLPIPLVFKGKRMKKIVEFFGLQWNDSADTLLTNELDFLLTTPIAHKSIEKEFMWICRQTEEHFREGGLNINLITE